MNQMKKLTDSNYDAFIKDGEKIILYTAGYCGICKTAAEEISQHFPQSGSVLLTDPQCVAIRTKINISKVPTLIIFRNGKEIKRAEGTTALFNYIDQA